MTKSSLFVPILLLVSYCSFAQGVGIGTTTPDPSAALDITATNKGLLIPRMNINSINAIVNPAKGLLVYDSAANQLMVNLGTPAGPNWQPVAASNSNGAWLLSGNGGTNPANQFVGTTDNRALRFRVNNIQAGELNPLTGNISWGLRAGQANTVGFANIAIGEDALKSNIEGSNLVAIGDSALFNNRGISDFLEGINNTAIGAKSMAGNTTGSFNTAVGTGSLLSNTTGTLNTATGTGSLVFNTTGMFNTAIGAETLSFNTTGGSNTANGFRALKSNTTALNNSAFGALSLTANTTGSENVAVGFATLNFNIIGDSNTAVGQRALLFNTTGSHNTSIGSAALFSNTTGEENTAVGSLAGNRFNMGFGNTLIGANADANQNGLSNATAIGAGAIVNASNKVRIGNGAVTVIEGQVPFTTPSDGRFKFNIKEDVKGLDFIMQLRPVTYQFDVNRFDHQWTGNSNTLANDIVLASYNEATAIRRTGFIAQEVEKAAIITGYNFSGIIKPKTEKEHYGLSYEAFVVPLVKAVQEQQQIISEQQLLLDVLKKQNADLQKRILNLEKR